MQYNHFDMLPEMAFKPIGKRMTLEGGGGGGVQTGAARAAGFGSAGAASAGAASGRPHAGLGQAKVWPIRSSDTETGCPHASHLKRISILPLPHRRAPTSTVMASIFPSRVPCPFASTTRAE